MRDQILIPNPSTPCGDCDRSVRRLKGPGWPINAEADPVAVIAPLSCLD
jgi:bifunctional ADP-heptose synthase (sugar kinase/adenylyltransferase)